MFKYRPFKAALAFMIALCLSSNSFAVSSQIVNSFYNYARSGQTSKMRQLMKMGYGIDVQNDDGYTAYCIAKKREDAKAMEVLEWMGADPDQKCKGDVGAGVIVGAVLGAAAVGGGAALAFGGGGGSDDPCAHKPHSTMIEGECVCNQGYIDQNDTCYSDLLCNQQVGSTGEQIADQCVCQPGYEGVLCDTCSPNYLNQGGICYMNLHCEEQNGSTGEQVGDQCVCKSGYEGVLCDSCTSGYVIGTGGICYEELGCVNGTQVDDQCVCNQGYTGTLCNECDTGYIMQGGVCYQELDCGEHGTQQGNSCVCETGWAGTYCDTCDDNYIYQNGECVLEKQCVNGTQQGDECICDTGWAGEYCDRCDSGYTMGTDGKCYPNINCGEHGQQENDYCVCDTGYAGDVCDECDTANGYAMIDGECRTQLDCGYGHQVGDECVCDEGYGHDGTGKCVAKGPDIIAIEEKTNHSDGEKLFDNQEYADIYGLKYNINDPENQNLVGNTQYLYNRFSTVGGSASSVKMESILNINNGGDGNVYGLYSDNAIAIYNMYTEINKSIPGTVSALISITNNGDGDVYGIWGTGEVHNGYYTSSIGDDFSIVLSSEVNIQNTGSGNVYGLYSSGDIYNENSWSSIDVSSDNSGSSAVSSAYGINSTGGQALNQGSVTVTSTNGNSYGINAYSSADNEGSITVSSAGQTAYGISAGDVDNSGLIDVTSSGSGNSYGIKSSGGNITNSGNLDVSGGLSSLGIDAQQATSIVNSGTIDVTSTSGNSSSVAKGIKAGGDGYGTLSNLGKINLTSSSNLNELMGIEAQGVIVEHGNVDGSNAAQINISSSSADSLSGISVNQGSATTFKNSVITITNVGGDEISGIMSGDNSQITHGGTISITSLKSSADKISGIVGENISVSDTAAIELDVSGLSSFTGVYGINTFDNQATSGTVSNAGNIEILGNSGTAMGVYSSATDVTNSGAINISSSSGTAYGIWSSQGQGYNFNNTGNIEITGTSGSSNQSDGYGIFFDGGSMDNSGEIIVGTATSFLGNAYGASSSGGATFVNNTDGQITVYGNKAYGINAASGSVVTNHGNITAVSGNDAYGIYSSGGSVTNSSGASISVTASSGEAFGIYAEGNSTVENAGSITVNTGSGVAYGIYASGGSVNNTGTITVEATSSGGGAYGIYAANGATVTNTGTISVDGEICTTGDCSGAVTNGNFIVIDDTSTFMNASLLSFDGAMDIDSFGGTTMLARGGKFVSNDEITAANLLISADVVEGGFEDEYVEEGALQAQKVAVNAVSNSAMFTASVQDGDEDGTKNVVMTRKSFDLLSADTSIASFLSNNYEQENNEELFNNLKKAPSLLAYSLEEAELLGYSLLPNFSRENMRVLRNLSDVFANELFETENNTPVRKMVGYDYFTQNRDTKGTLTGYDNYANTMYFMYDRELENTKARLGAGMSITQFYSSYDDDSSRKEIMLQVLMPAYYEMNNGIKLASVARLGYGDGDYKRKADGTTFEGDLSEWIYGLSNAARYGIDWGWVIFEPTVELNVLGYYQDSIDEDEGKAGAISADAENNLSVEAGIGFRLKKDIEEFYGNKLSFNLGAMYYHEFANPYHSLTASMEGMTGTYRITDYEGIYDRDRGVIKAGFEYGLYDLTLYGNFYQFIEDENPFSVNLGLKYNF